MGIVLCAVCTKNDRKSKNGYRTCFKQLRCSTLISSPDYCKLSCELVPSETTSFSSKDRAAGAASITYRPRSTFCFRANFDLICPASRGLMAYNHS